MRKQTKHRRFDLTMTLSLSLNCQLSDRNCHQTFILPLAWLTMEMTRWQQLAGQIKTALTFTGILGRSLAWGMGL